MLNLLGGAALFASLCLLAVVAHRLLLGRRATLRLGADDTDGIEALAEAGSGDRSESSERGAREALGPLLRAALPASVGLASAAIVYSAIRVGPIACAVGFDAGVVVWLRLSARHERHLARLEAQLAEALRLTAA